jgi:hypothetical protein
MAALPAFAPVAEECDAAAPAETSGRSGVVELNFGRARVAAKTKRRSGRAVRALGVPLGNSRFIVILSRETLGKCEV